jgi:hypothetical protein
MRHTRFFGVQKGPFPRCLLSTFLFMALASPLSGAFAQVATPSPVATPISDPVSPGDDGPVRVAGARCNDFTIRFIESSISQPYPNFPLGGGPVLDPNSNKGTREMTANFVCHSDGGFTLPTITSMHLIEAGNGKICHRQRSCGNLKRVGGYFGIEVGWSRFSGLSEFLVSQDFVRQTTNYNGLSISLSAYVSFEHFDRYCSASSEPMCLHYAPEESPSDFLFDSSLGSLYPSKSDNGGNRNDL